MLAGIAELAPWADVGSSGGGGEGEGTVSNFVPDQLLVMFRPGTTPAQRALIAHQAGGQIVQYYSAVNTALIQLTTGSDVQAAVARWSAFPEVRIAEPNFVYQWDRLPNDPLFNDQYGLHNFGQIPFFGTPDADIDAPEAWDITVGSRNVVIAVLDSGIDVNHPDLRDNLFINTGEIPGNSIDDDGNGFIDDVFGWNGDANNGNVTDTFGHGTHVAGIIGARGNNGIGVSGVSWEVTLLPLKLGDSAPTLAGIVGAHNYMFTMKRRGVNIRASNHSYGGPTFSGIELALVQQAFQEGILYVAAAGNNGTNNDLIPNYPSGYDVPNVIAVAASDWNDQLTAFSQFGPQTVDLAAPGDFIISTYPIGLGSIGPNLEYEYLPGTSMATPMVTGVAALLYSLEPSLTPVQVKSLILNSVDVLPQMQGKLLTGGRLNARKAIELLPTGAFRGVVYEDLNRNGRREFNEFGIANAVVFVDLNGNRLRDPSEPFAVTGADGSYNIVNFHGAGTYTILVEPIPGLQPINPPGGGRQITVPGRQDVIPDVDFGFGRPPGIEPGGIVWNDLDGNGQQDPGEPGIAGAYVWFDINNNGRPDFGEPAVRTGPNGRFTLPLIATGSYTLRVQVGPSWRQTFPAAPGTHTVVIGGGGTTAQIVDFGFTGGDLLDFGNAAPGGRDTFLSDNGPRHGILPGFQLGPTLTGEVDANGPDDNDGIVFPSRLIAGQQATLSVDVRLGGQSRGLLQGWIDFNNDGDFNDPGEQVIRDLRLGEGVHQVTISVPPNAVTGAVRARFRYGWERGLGPTGPAMAGEVEDYGVLISGDVPQAVNDTFSVPQDSVQVVLDVLANDLASSAGGLRVQSATSPTSRGGTVTVPAGGQNVLYTPRVGFFGTDTFDYTIIDNAGRTATARVTVNVVPTFVAPQAVDDQDFVARNNDPPNIPLDPLNKGKAIAVLANDILGANPPTRISAIVSGPSHGAVVIDNRGTPQPDDDVIRYQPVAGFEGVDQFRYRITDSVGASSEATVTLFVGDAFSNDLVRYSVSFTNLAGAPISSVEVGQDFVVVVTVDDIRTTATTPDLPPDSERGVFAAYLDLLYPGTLVQIQPPLRFDGDYRDTPEGNTSVPGIIDEAGAFRSFDQPPPGPGPKVLYRAVFRAVATGTATFLPDPADDVFNPGPPPVFGNHDTLLYEPPSFVSINDITYLGASINIVASGEARPMHNYTMANDVNGDRRVNTHDLLLLIARLRQGATGEGELSRNQLYYDTTNDSRINTLDAFNILRELRSQSVRSTAEGEGEAPSSADLLQTAGADNRPVPALDPSSVLLVHRQDPVGPSTAPGSAKSKPEDRTPRVTTFVGGRPALATNERPHDRAVREWLGHGSGHREDLVNQLDDEFFKEIGSRWNRSQE
ncbi:MAG: hypothetical protein KatS3mg110_0572 [Pirellulaceae bacterium]|nr:MAG: hypothetical protein KatS3mg110_0572 [Pirellulaceae bacterium]